MNSTGLRIKGNFSLRRFFMRVSFVSLILIAVTCVMADDMDDLPRMGEGRFPQAFIWWTTANRVVENAESESEADRILSLLDGVASPCIHLPYFSGFKKRHPDQFVFLFCQGHDFSEKPTVYDPVDRSQFYPGHWVYCEGTTIRNDIPAESGETNIEVEDASKFRLQEKNGRTISDDICLVALDDVGKPNWLHSEQVKLVSIDEKRNIIRVRRGCYETKPSAFQAKKAMAAAHASEPWGYDGGISWVINYSSRCPHDPNGQSASDVLLTVIAPMFAQEGVVSNFDGLEFDVSPFRASGQLVDGRSLDTDGDLQGDGGYADGVNLWGIGYYRFCERVRDVLGSNRWFMADGRSGPNHQRNFGVLNGIESEWWPDWGDNDITNWSNGFNAHEYWEQNCFSPSMNYIVHKIGGHDRQVFIDAPWARHRLVLAAAQLLGSAVTSFYTPQAEPGQPFGIFDELVGGERKQTGWLGHPLEPYHQLALDTPNLLAHHDVSKLLQGESLVVKKNNSGINIQPKEETSKKSLKFQLVDFPCHMSEDLVISLEVSSSSRPGWPQAIPRFMTVSHAGRDFKPLGTFVGTEPFTATFYFRNMPSNQVTLDFEIEGEQSLTLHEIRAYAHADAMYRKFEDGLVLANPSDRSYTFDLSSIQPNTSFQRITGSQNQDPVTNNGNVVNKTVTLGARDGLFLLRVDSK
ncbi:hypothetical protein GF373_11305 [bacterium]|nr:hypothetical protein [bacterium]